MRERNSLGFRVNCLDGYNSTLFLLVNFNTLLIQRNMDLYQ